MMPSDCHTPNKAVENRRGARPGAAVFARRMTLLCLCPTSGAAQRYEMSSRFNCSLLLFVDQLR